MRSKEDPLEEVNERFERYCPYCTNHFYCDRYFTVYCSKLCKQNYFNMKRFPHSHAFIELKLPLSPVWLEESKELIQDELEDVSFLENGEKKFIMPSTLNRIFDGMGYPPLSSHSYKKRMMVVELIFQTEFKCWGINF